MMGSFEDDMDYNYRHRNDPPPERKESEVWMETRLARMALDHLHSTRASIDEKIAGLTALIEANTKLCHEKGWKT